MLYRFCLAVPLLWPLLLGAAPLNEDSGEWGEYQVWQPAETTRGLLFLFSGDAGIQPDDRAAAEALAQLGLVVALVDSRTYWARMGQEDTEPDPERCLDATGAFVWTAHALQKKLGLAAYTPAYLAGRGSGAALAYIALAQSSKHTFAGGVGVDFSPRIPARRPLCQLTTQSAPSGLQLGEYALAAPWRAVSSAAPSYAALLREQFSQLLAENTEAAQAVPSLPVVEVSAHSRRGVLVVIYSGDGGWRDIDKRLGDYLKDQDYAVLGVDVLSYFWSERAPAEVAGDLSELLAYYQDAWQMPQVVLLGYSFGADILPFAYNRLPAARQSQVILLGLLAPGRAADFEVHMSGWFGSGPSEKALAIPPELRKIAPAKILCGYGEDEKDDSLCTDPAARDVEILKTAGDHHFDGDYEALGARIQRAIERRRQP